MHRLIFALILFVTLAAQSVFPQDVLDRIVAIVDDNIILQSELDQVTVQFGLQSGVDPRKDPEKFAALRKQMLERMIEQKVLFVKAQEDSVEVDEHRVDTLLQQQIDGMVQQLGSPEKVEEYFGTSMRRIKHNFRDEIRERLLVQTLQSQKFNQIPVSRREVIEFYKTMKDSLPELPEAVNLSHILVSIQPSEAAKQKALAKIKEAQKKLEAGVDFSEVAREYSEDPGSASKGGDLGFQERGNLVRDFEEAAFKLEVGETSGIVKTEFGYHIIKLLDRRGEKIRPQHILVRVPVTEADKNRTVHFLDSLRTAILAGKLSFAEAAKQFSEDETSRDKGGNLGWFETGQLQVQEFRSVAENLKEGEISEPIKTQFGYHLVRLNKRRQPRPLSLDKDWEQISNYATNMKRSKQFEKWVQEIRKDLYIKTML